jgi:hypothetical protein
MSLVVDALFAAVILLAVVHFLLPRQSRLHQARGRLHVRPPLAALLGESTLALMGLLLTASGLVLLLRAHLFVGAGLAALVLARLTWQLSRRWQTAGLVFDRTADVIRQDRVTVGRVSQVAGLHVTGRPDPALEVVLRTGPLSAGPQSTGAASSGGASIGTSGDELRYGSGDAPAIVWPVPGVDGADAPTVGRTIADYLQVPLVTRIE